MMRTSLLNLMKGSSSQFKKKTSLAKLVAARDWDGIREHLKTPEGQKQAAVGPDFTGISVLTSALSFQPPVDIIRDLVDLQPDSALSTEGYLGQLPLHVACQYGASSEVVGMLLCKYHKAVLTADDEGKFPLHFAVEFALEEAKFKEADVARGFVVDHEDALRVVSLLAQEAPAVIHKLDMRGYSPLTIAGRSKAPKCNEVFVILDRLAEAAAGLSEVGDRRRGRVLRQPSQKRRNADGS